MALNGWAKCRRTVSWRFAADSNSIRQMETPEHPNTAKGSPEPVTRCHPSADLLNCSVPPKCNLVRISKFSTERLFRILANDYVCLQFLLNKQLYSLIMLPNPCIGHNSEGESFSHQLREEAKKPGV